MSHLYVWGPQKVYAFVLNVEKRVINVKVIRRMFCICELIFKPMIYEFVDCKNRVYTHIIIVVVYFDIYGKSRKDW